MTKKYIRQHLGLGDHIICNALVRHFCEQNDEIVLFTSGMHYENVKFMFRDISNLEVMPFSNHPSNADQEINRYISSNNIGNDVITVGFGGLSGFKTRFDIAFYKMHDLNPEMKVDNFYCERDEEMEDYVYNYLNPENEKYIFVIDDDKHHLKPLVIDQTKLPKGYKIIKYDKTLNYNDNRFLMYNYRKIMENAEEIHMFQSAFSEFVNATELKKPKVYLHIYLRDYSDGLPILSKNDLNFVY